MDVSILEALVGDDADVVARVLDVYIDSTSSVALELRAGMAAGDATRVRRAAHRIKSSSLAIGAVPLGRVCEELEVAGPCGDWARLQALHEAFEGRWHEVRGCARKIIDGIATALGTSR